MLKKGRYGQFLSGLLTVGDFLVLNIVYILVGEFGGGGPMFFSKISWLIVNFSFFIAIYLLPSIHNRRVVFADQVALQAIKLVFIHAFIFISVISFLGTGDVGIIIYLRFYSIFLLFLSFWWILSRKLLKRYRTKGFNFKRIIIIGGGTVGIRLLDEMDSDLGYGYRVMGFFDNDRNARTVKNYKGTLNDIENFVKENLIDEMYCALPDNEDVSKMIRIAENNAVDFFFVPQFGRNLTRRFVLNSIGNVPVMAIRPNPLNLTYNKLVKRSFDVLFSSVVLVLSPIILIPVAIGIKLSSPGPIFFKQKRTGYRGEAFSCYKFRTMKVNKDSDKVQASRRDPRKTRFGDFLRKTSIDELPQFFNVWRGDMSIVGPRPHMLIHTQDYSQLIDKYMVRHTIKPGITGWAQVNGYRGQTDKLWQMEKRVEFDVWYAENWNLMLDLKIMLLTVINVFKGEKNAF